MKKTITLKDKYTVHLHLELRTNKDNKPVFSCCADCNRLHTHGQGLDKINPYMQNNDLWKIIYRLWKAYHLNDMHAGTTLQEAILEDDFGEFLCELSYKEKCNWLLKYNLLNDNGYVYGSGWIYMEIPADDLYLIKTLIES